MRYRFLGRTGLKISDLCLGTMNFGDVTDEKESCMIMDKAIDAGINFFDTANIYGGLRMTGICQLIIFEKRVKTVCDA